MQVSTDGHAFLALQPPLRSQDSICPYVTFITIATARSLLWQENVVVCMEHIPTILFNTETEC